MSEITLDPIEDHLNARHLAKLIDRWFASLDVEPGTLTTYRNKITHFIRWWKAKGPLVEWRLTRALMQEFEVSLRGIVTKRFGKPMSYHNRHGIIRTVRMMFKWAAGTDRTVRNYGAWVPWPSGAPPQRKSATVEQLARLMVAASRTRHALRNQTIVAFFIGTGCRLGEVTGLQVEDLQMMADGSGTANVTGKRTKANPSGQRSVAFDANTGQWLIQHINRLGVSSGPMWFSERGRMLALSSIYQMVKHAIISAGLKGQVRGCHDLRRAFATILSLLHPDAPGWADMIRRQLGHKHYRQTATYALIGTDDIRSRIITPLAL